MKGLSLVLAVGWTLAANAEGLSPANVIAHRGFLDDADAVRLRPENSLAAFEDAVANGFGFECDVVYTKDKRVFTMHDGCFARCFGIDSEDSAAMTWNYVSNLVHVTGKEDKVRHPYTRPALFEEVCALARDGRWIFVEVKTGPEIVPLIRDILVHQRQATPKNLAFISFNAASIAELKRQLPEYKAHLLLGSNSWQRDDGEWVTDQSHFTAEECVRRLKACHADGLDFEWNPKVAEQGAAFVKAIKDAGFEFHYWCVDNREDAEEALRRGADTLTSNRPAPIVGTERKTQPAPTKRPMALVVMWDGTRADSIVNADAKNLRKLASGTWQSGYNGAWSFCGKPVEDARPYSFANHAAILSGVTRAKHGVTFNHTAERCDTKNWPCWLTRLLDAQPQKKAAFFYACGPANWAMCRDERVLHADYGLDDKAKAARLVELYSTPGAAPDAAVAFFEAADAKGHVTKFYPSSSEYRASIAGLDALLGEVLAAIAARPTFADEDWLILLTADHGGYEFMHGWEDAHSRTTPIVLAGRRVVNGQMAGFPRGQDVAATMLAHFGVDRSKMNLDSVELGKAAATWGPAARLDEALVWYYPTLGKTKYLVNAVKDGPGATLFGDEEYFNPNRANGPFKSPCLWVGGDENVSVGAHLDDSVAMCLGVRPAFTVAFWAKMEEHPGQPVICGNKDFSRAGSPGFVIAQGLHTERAKNGLCLVFGTPEGEDRIVGTYDIEYGKWGFYAAVFTQEGQVWLYQGRTDGSFHWITARAENALLGSGLPISIGNDGRGTYRWNYMDFLDDIAVWKRPLTINELRCIFQAGLKGRQLAEILQLDVRSTDAQDLIDTTEKAGIAM